MFAQQTDSRAATDFEAELRAMADALHGATDADDCKPVLLGLAWRFCVSGPFEDRRLTALAECRGEVAEDPSEDIFGVSRGAGPQAEARQPTRIWTVDAGESGGHFSSLLHGTRLHLGCREPRWGRFYDVSRSCSSVGPQSSFRRGHMIPRGVS